VMVQYISRHGDVAVTRQHYIKTTSERSIAAMARLESALGALCADRALNVIPTRSALPN